MGFKIVYVLKREIKANWCKVTEESHRLLLSSVARIPEMYNGFLSYQEHVVCYWLDYSQDQKYWCFLCLLHGPVEDALPLPAQLLTLLEALFHLKLKVQSFNPLVLPFALVFQTRCSRSQLSLEGEVRSKHATLKRLKQKTRELGKAQAVTFFPSPSVDQRENTQLVLDIHGFQTSWKISCGFNKIH